MNSLPLRFFYLFTGNIFFWLSASNPLVAEIIPDNTLPENSTVTPKDNIRVIEGGTRRGDNLFHSFREFSFSVRTADTTGDTASFNNNLTVRNIITRVTGNSASNIDGILEAKGTANLFFINPNGIIFGPNSKLQIGGSFIASTANSIRFLDGTEFLATASETPPLLAVSVPIGLQFGGTEGNILVQGAGLAVQPGQTLALVGGNIIIRGGDLAAAGGTNVAVPQGRIELGSVAGFSLVNLTPVDKGWTLGYQNIQGFQDIELSEGGFVDASGDISGDIQVQGRRIVLSNGAQIASVNLGEQQGGNVLVKASDIVELVGTITIADAIYGSSIGSQVANKAMGNGGNVIIETGKLLIRNGAYIEASTFGAGRAGDLSVKAFNSVALVGRSASGPSGIFAQVARRAIANAGNAGNLTIETQQLTILDGAQISTAARTGGKGGTLTINASDSIQISGARPLATRNLGRSGIFVSAEQGATRDAGELNISTGQLIVENGAEISANNFGPGRGGTATLNVRQLIIRNGGEVRARAFASGAGGNLIVNSAELVDIAGLGTIGSETFPSSLSTSSEASGNAGNLFITTNRLNVLNLAEVTVSSTGSGQAGNLEIIARSLKLDNEGKLIGKTTSSDGGNITLNLRDLLLLRRNSEISTSAGGNGGAIAINIPDGFIVTVPSENSDMTANAFSGKGGSVTLNATGIFGLVPRSRDELEQLLGTTDPTQLDPSLLPTNDVTAISQQNPSLNGQVIINTPNVDPSRGLVQLPTEPVNVEVVQGCQPGGQQSSSVAFFNTGKGGLAVNPYEPLSSSNIWEDVSAPLPMTDEGTTRQGRNLANLPDKIVEAQGWVTNKKGEVVLVAEIPTIDSQNLCRFHEAPKN